MKRSIILLAVGVVVALAFVLLGMHSARTTDSLFRVVWRVRHQLLAPSPSAPSDGIAIFNEYGQLTAYPGKHEVPKPAITDRTMVAFAFGQSNSANHGGEKYRAATDGVFNYWNGRYFLAEDPLLGASGRQGSVWTLLANKLVAAKAFDSVILATAGIAGTSAQAWAPGGRLNGMLESRLADARSGGLTITHFFWHQGETDNNDAGVAGYETAMRDVIALTKRYFPQSKFFVVQASLCERAPPANSALRAIQKRLAELPGVYAGPDADQIGFDDRYDDCHLSARGLEKLADGWVSALSSTVK